MKIRLGKGSRLSSMITMLDELLRALKEYSQTKHDISFTERMTELLFLIKRNISILRSFEQFQKDELFASNADYLIKVLLSKINLFLQD